MGKRRFRLSYYMLARMLRLPPDVTITDIRALPEYVGGMCDVYCSSERLSERPPDEIVEHIDVYGRLGLEPYVNLRRMVPTPAEEAVFQCTEHGSMMRYQDGILVCALCGWPME